MAYFMTLKKFGTFYSFCHWNHFAHSVYRGAYILPRTNGINYVRRLMQISLIILAIRNTPTHMCRSNDMLIVWPEYWHAGRSCQMLSVIFWQLTFFRLHALTRCSHMCQKMRICGMKRHFFGIIKSTTILATRENSQKWHRYKIWHFFS